MREAVIVSTARTPLTKAHRGEFNITPGPTLAAFAVKAAVERSGVDPALIEDAVLGCGYPEGTTGRNIARQTIVRAGLPIGIAGVTVSRFCASGLQAIAMAAGRIVAEGVNKARGPSTGFLVITHYQRLLEYIVPDKVHIMYDGRIVHTGGKELALELEAKVYDWVGKELAKA